MFGGLVPDDVLARRTKASFDGAFWNRHSRAFAAGWGGGGVDADLVDTDALRREWAQERPDARTFTLLQAAWLAKTLQRAATASSSRSPASATESQRAGPRQLERRERGEGEQRLVVGGRQSHAAVVQQPREALGGLDGPHVDRVAPGEEHPAAKRQLRLDRRERHPPALALADDAELLARAELLGRLAPQVDRARPREGGPVGDDQHVVAHDRLAAQREPREQRALPELALPEDAPHAAAGHERAAVERLAARASGR